jgi:hypothetical protein
MQSHHTIKTRNLLYAVFYALKKNIWKKMNEHVLDKQFVYGVSIYCLHGATEQMVLYIYFFNRVYSLEIQSVMLVFSTQLCELLSYNLLSG